MLCSKRAQLFSHLDGLRLCCATNVRDFSRVWRVIACVALQMCATFLAFGGLWLVWCSKRGEFVSRLDGCGWFGAPNVRDDLPERLKRSARRQLGAETRLGWKSSGLPTRVS